jgi:hypothetical protein
MSDVIREFLVSLGFRIDANGMRRFQDAVTGSTTSVMGLGSAALSAGVQMGDALEKMTRKYESLNYASQRTGTTVQHLQAVAYAASQVGMSAEEGAAAMEGFAEAMRKNPAIEGGLVSQYGKIQGDKAKEFISFIKGVKKELGDTDQGYSVAHQIAGLAGIPEHTFYQLFKYTDKFEKKFDEFSERQTEGGFDAKTFAEKSVKFQDSLGGLGASLTSMRERFYSGLIDPAQASVEALDALTRAANRQISKSPEKVHEDLEKKRSEFRKSSFGKTITDFFGTGDKAEESGKIGPGRNKYNSEQWSAKKASNPNVTSPASSNWLDVIAMIESGGRPNVQTGRYKGVFQLSDEEFKKYGGGNIWDAADNRRAAAAKLEAQKAVFRRRHDRNPSLTELYMMHQQGEGGAEAHMAHPERAAWANMLSTAEGRKKGSKWAQRAIWGNVPSDMRKRFPGGVTDVTSQDFMGMWGEKVDRFSARLGGARGGDTQTAPAASETAPGGTSNAITQTNHFTINSPGDAHNIKSAVMEGMSAATGYFMVQMDGLR